MLKQLFLLTLVALIYGAPANKEDKVFGGHEVAEGERPYQVSLIAEKAEKMALCGGSILSARWVLTAAHCVEDMEKIEIRAGSLKFDSGGVTAITNTYQIHPLNDPYSLDFDVALIDFGSDVIPLNNSTIKAVKLIDESEAPEGGTPVIVSGWGRTEDGFMSHTLMEVEVFVVDNTECKELYHELTDSMLCAGVEEGGKDSCQGDSGGPLVLSSDNTQVGIVSWGYGCAMPGWPGVYSNIASFRDWITSVTGI